MTKVAFGTHLIGAFLAAAIVCSPARAQEIGSLVKKYEPAEIPETTKLNPADDARVAFDAYAACVIRYNPGKVRAALQLAIDDPAYTRMLADAAVDDCLMSGEIRFSMDRLRGALYTALYRSQFAHMAVPLGENPLFPYSAVLTSGSKEVQQHALLVAFADCVVRKNPSESRALVLGPTAKRQEAVALEGLTPILGTCMPQGATVHFSKAMLYGLIAEALYRESVAATPATDAAKVTH
jgi:hypothetical protein